jgi:hypothetical protein
MRRITSNARVKNIGKGMLAEKQIADSSETASKLWVSPQPPKVCNCVDKSFLLFEIGEKSVEVQAMGGH